MTIELAEADAALRDLEEATEQGIEHIERAAIAVIDSDTEYIKPWDQQPGEADGFYKLFLHFRDQGVGRGIQQTWQWGRESGTSEAGLNSFYSYGKTYDWRNRAKSWDKYQENQYQIARAGAIRAMAERHAGEIESAITALTTPMRALQQRIEDDPEFIRELSRTDARKLIDMVNRASRTLPGLMSAERLARGMPTHIVEGVVEHQHSIHMEVDQIADVLGILERAGVIDTGSRALGSGEVIDAEVVEVHPVSTDDNG